MVSESTIIYTHIHACIHTHIYLSVACDILVRESTITSAANAGANGVLIPASTAEADLSKLITHAHACGLDAVVLCVNEKEVSSACEKGADAIALDSKLLGMDGAVALKA
jgi:indole-3-glycerol phosphate synthase